MLNIEQHTPTNHGQNLYNRVRVENEIDLIQLVRNLLIDAGLKQAVLEVYDTNRFIHGAWEANAEVQRFALNRFWNLQLMRCPVASTEERFCLIANGSVLDWFTLFKEKVMPYIISNELPKQ